MYALTVVLCDDKGCRVSRGTLFQPPAELMSPYQMQFYMKTAHGWSRCPLGYDVLTRVSSSGHRVIVPAVNLEETSTPKRRFPDYRLRFQRSQIEEFAATIVNEDARVEEARNAELANLTHDLRALSTEIYHAAELARNNLETQQAGQAAIQVGTVIAAQQMMSLRLDVVDYATGKAFEQGFEKIPVYKKVDKVYRCFIPKSLVREQRLSLKGPSHGLTYGAPLFELIPFVLVENAMKYSPGRLPVEIEVSEDETEISVTVKSFGPRILPQERERVFDKGFRGAEAVKSGQSGTGVGLFAAKSLVEQSFGGRLELMQANDWVSIDRTVYYQTTFKVIVPRVA